MPSPIHFSIKICSKGKGGSAIQKSAYQSQEKMMSEEQNRTYSNFTRQEVIEKKVLLADGVPEEFSDREKLWNSVEAFEHKNPNADFARYGDIAIPRGLNQKQAKNLIATHFERYRQAGMCVDYSIHWPPDNPHVHFMLTMRPWDPKTGTWAKARSRGFYKLDQNGQKIPQWQRDPATHEFLLDKDGQKIQKIDPKTGRRCWQRGREDLSGWDKKADVWRKGWEIDCNHALKAAGLQERVTAKSYADQGLDKIPTMHEGPAGRIKNSEVVAKNREIKAANEVLAKAHQASAASLKARQNYWRQRNQHNKEAREKTAKRYGCQSDLKSVSVARRNQYKVPANHIQALALSDPDREVGFLCDFDHLEKSDQDQIRSFFKNHSKTPHRTMSRFNKDNLYLKTPAGKGGKGSITTIPKVGITIAKAGVAVTAKVAGAILSLPQHIPLVNLIPGVKLLEMTGEGMSSLGDKMLKGSSDKPSAINAGLDKLKTGLDKATKPISDVAGKAQEAAAQGAQDGFKGLNGGGGSTPNLSSSGKNGMENWSLMSDLERDEILNSIENLERDDGFTISMSPVRH